MKVRIEILNTDGSVSSVTEVEVASIHSNMVFIEPNDSAYCLVDGYHNCYRDSGYRLTEESRLACIESQDNNELPR